MNIRTKEITVKTILAVKALIVILLMPGASLVAQENTIRISDGREATPGALPEPPADALGYPDRSADLDVLPGFFKPPRGYGQVPFFWWPGDRLTRERLSWQLGLLEEAGIQGMTVSYNHSHFLADPELNKDFIGPHGRTHAGDPPVFSDEWWDIWKWFSAETGKRNMGLGLKDYTFNFSGYWHDEVRALPEFNSYRGQLDIRKVAELQPGEPFEHTIGPDSTFTVIAYPVINDKIDVADAVDLFEYEDDGRISWAAPAGSHWQVFESVTTTSEAYMLHPDHGKEHCNHYFQRFEDRMDDEGRKGMNYFLQDELGSPAYLVGPGTWSEDFPVQFKDRKGYDIRPYLPALTVDIGPVTSKVRLDYMDVVMDLVEERFYKPIFDWHWERGLIYGVDNWGRGLNPTAYGDYFRVTRWFTAPGNDAPGRGESFIQTKVSSSVAHLYERPRVWLEAFHSIGWDTSPDELTGQIDRHYLFGGNFFNLHGLYYTLHGGWWEWAPPCFHFRMPYWPHFKYLLEYTERLSYLLSQGRHIADVALIYPVAPGQVNPDYTPDIAFDAGKKLFNAGVDFTFMDYQSLARAEVRDGNLHVAGSSYPVLILADLPAIRFNTLTQALLHFRSGGIVLALGGLPNASDRLGSDDPEVDKIVKELFGVTATEISAGHIAVPQRNSTGGLGLYVSDTADLATVLAGEMVRDFISSSGKGRVLHRRVGFRDLYMVMDVNAGEECFFRARGKVELWDAWTGTVRELPVIRQTDEGTVLRIPVDPPRSSLIVFSPGNPLLESKVSLTAGTSNSETIYLDDLWDFELVPTSDNRWGDFRLPATSDIIGAEARELHYKPVEQSGDSWNRPDDEDINSSPLVRTTFGPQMYKLHACARVDFDSLVRVAAKSEPAESQTFELGDIRIDWQPYEFSWRWGVLDQPGSQGWHGLKGRVDDRFIILGDDGHFIFSTFLTLEKETEVEVLIEGVKPEHILINNESVSGNSLHLEPGTHKLLLAYRNIQQGRGPGGRSPVDLRERSAVVFIRAEETTSVDSHPLAMKWYGHSGLLPFDFYRSNPPDGFYRFFAPPGFKGMHFTAYGAAEAMVDGNQAALITSSTSPREGAIEYSLVLDEPQIYPVPVDLRVRHQRGYYGGAAFTGPFKIETGKGKIRTGDWSRMGVLHHYSGGIRYGQTFDLTGRQAEGLVTLDLGEVIATCELVINSRPAGILINSPFTTDISEYVKQGANRIEVLVYNTLSNHYQTTPSPYKGNPASGLIGPVRIIIE